MTRRRDQSGGVRRPAAARSPLLEHDARSRAKLMPTLRSYLDHAGHKAQTVRALRVQRRTLYARLARIEAILRRDLDTADTRTRLTPTGRGRVREGERTDRSA